MAHRQLRAALLFAVTAVFCMTSAAPADVYVRGYTKENGTYVAPHYRSDPDGIKTNNWSTEGNTNPYNLKPGYKKIYDPYR